MPAGRPSKLKPEQWSVIERRMIEGTPVRVLAREYGVSEGAIRQRKTTQVTEIKVVAQKLADAEQAINRLPISSQPVARSLAHKLVAISDNLCDAAAFGSAASRHLQEVAYGQAIQVVDGSAKSMKRAKAAILLTQAANSAQIGANALLAATQKNPLPHDDVGALEDMSRDELRKVIRSGT